MAPENRSLIERAPGDDWRQLQDRVATILTECGMTTEVAKTIHVARGSVEVDVYAEDPTTRPRGVYICECKLWRSRVPQARVQTFRTIIGDAGAHFGIFVSAGGFQAGALEVVQHTNVHLLNWVEFQALFAKRWCTVHLAPTVRAECGVLASHAEMPGNDAPIRHSHGEAINEAEAVGSMVNGFWSPPFVELGIGNDQQSIVDEIWEERDAYLPYLPQSVAEAASLRELLDALVTFAREWKRSRAEPPRDA